jgi:hypothetical protein
LAISARRRGLVVKGASFAIADARYRRV